MSGPKIEYRHFLPKQNTIWQMNHTAINSSIWTTNSQSLSVFKILKFAAQFLIFLDTHLKSPNPYKQQNNEQPNKQKANESLAMQKAAESAENISGMKQTKTYEMKFPPFLLKKIALVVHASRE